MKKTTIILSVILVAMFGVAVYVFPLLPDRVVIHWNATGQANGYGSRFMGAYFAPLLLLFLDVLFLFIPHLDPLKQNIVSFRRSYDRFVIFFSLFIAYVYILSLVWNLGRQFDFTVTIIPAVSSLFIMIASVLKESKRNWFIGIRTPWTLSSDTVWDKTHQVGAKLFFVAGIVGLLGMVVPHVAIYFILVPIIAAATISVFYSYWVYKAEQASH